MFDGHGAPRAVGRRVGFAALPLTVRSWVEDQFGQFDVAAEYRGGMSAGCAASLSLADGRQLFLKAVGAELNAQSVALFRSERALLERLEPAPYRPRLIDAFDDAGWVALVFDHVDGRYPDLADDHDFEAVAQVVWRQCAELTPPPSAITDVPLLTDSARRWAKRWNEINSTPQRFLPSWAVDRMVDLRARVESLPASLDATTLCHFDIRDDNLLIGSDETVVILDWGMARLGPSWTDLVLLAAQRPDPISAQRFLQACIRPDDDDTVTNLLIAFAGSQAWNAQQPPRPSLPTFSKFCREDSTRLFASAEHRLSL